MSKYQFCVLFCSTTVPSRLPTGDRYWRRATSGTAVPMHHGNSCASGSLVVCPKIFGCAAAEGAQNERERQPARRKCAEDARVAPARKMLSSVRKAPSSLVSAQDIAPSFSLATGTTHASIEHSPADGGRDDLGGHVLCGRPAEQGRWHAWRAGWPLLSR